MANDTPETAVYTDADVLEAREDDRKVKAAKLQLARLDEGQEPKLRAFLEAVVCGMDVHPAKPS